MQTAGIIFIFVGFFMNFFGYKYLKKALLTISFFLGFFGSLYLLKNINILELPFLLLVSLIIGGIITFVVNNIFEFGIFIIGALAGGSLYLIYTLLGSSGINFDQNTLIYLVLFSALGGLFSLVLRKYVLILSTSIVGSFLLTLSTFIYSSNINFDDDIYSQLNGITYNYYFVVFLAIFILGILFQVGLINKILQILNINLLKEGTKDTESVDIKDTKQINVEQQQNNNHLKSDTIVNDEKTNDINDDTSEKIDEQKIDVNTNLVNNNFESNTQNDKDVQVGK